ncbi:hypothetical protein Tco_0009532 [Tanacetum coccineum]
MLLIQLQSVQERLRLFNNPTKAIEVPINKDNTGLSSSLNLNSKLVYPSPSTFGKSKMTNLATNPLMQEPVFKPDYLKAAKQEEERYYVVFKGPRAGIYTTWGETQKICQEDKSTNKKFRILEQAQMELRLYGEAKKTTPLLKPKIVVQLWNKARAACQQDFINERFYTTDKPTKSLYNFVEGSDPQLIYQAFRAGLINNIYPSNNLLEIKESAGKNEELHFSKAMEDKLQNPFLEVIKNQRVQSLKRISEIILQAITEENRKVNYADSHCIVISYKNEAEEQDIQLLTQYGIPFLTNTIDAASTTKEAFCKHAKQLFEEHSCIFCQDKSKEKDVGPSTTPKEPTTDRESFIKWTLQRNFAKVVSICYFNLLKRFLSILMATLIHEEKGNHGYASSLTALL